MELVGRGSVINPVYFLLNPIYYTRSIVKLATNVMASIVGGEEESSNFRGGDLARKTVKVLDQG